MLIHSQGLRMDMVLLAIDFNLETDTHKLVYLTGEVQEPWHPNVSFL
jgi:hypothetical protein